MKRYIYGILAALAMFSACEAVQPQEEFIPEDVQTEPGKAEMMVFTASLEPETKTALEWSEDTQTYKTLWEEDDVIWIYDSYYGTRTAFELVEGAGTTTAKFAGSITPQDEYTALYSDWVELGNGWGGVVINQRYEKEMVMPMAAHSTSTTLNFKNLCSLLCVSLTGDGEYVQEIMFTAHTSDYGSGYLEFGFNGEIPEIYYFDTNRSPISIFPEATLSSTPQDFFILVPPANYLDGFDLVVKTDKGNMRRATYNETVFERSQVRRVNLEFDEAYLVHWGLVGDFNNWSNDIEFELAGEYWVIYGQELEAGVSFKARWGADWQNNLGGYYGNEVVIDGPTLLSQGGPNMYVPESGTYDIYLEPDEQVIYVMSQGRYPEGEVEKPSLVWSLIGSMTDWSGDYDMTEEDGIWTLKNIYLEAGAEFKFRVNHDWNAGDLGLNDYLPENGEMTGLFQYSGNIMVKTTGYYNLYLDVDKCTLRSEYLGS